MVLPVNIPFEYIRPALHALDPEVAHSVTIKALKCGLGPLYNRIDDPSLRVELGNLVFENPVGLAAGFDKNAEAMKACHDIGFGFIETGGVTTVPQEGLPKPRIFRDIENEAIINKMNFPNVGMEEFKKNIERYRKNFPALKTPLGIQIAKSANQNDPEKDFFVLLEKLGQYPDYIVINISCPNTPGLRDLEEKSVFTDLMTQLLNKRAKLGLEHIPFIVKLSPDITKEKFKGLAKACLELSIDGVTLTNTTTQRPEFLEKEFRSREGGLSGKPLTERSTELIREFYNLSEGKITIIGVGGISSGQDAYDKIKAGASLVQLYSALVFKGPEVVRQINKDLITLLHQDGYKNISDAVGTAA